MASDPYIKMSFNVSEKFYKALKIECVLRGMTMTSFIKEAIKEKFDKQRKEREISK